MKFYIRNNKPILIALACVVLGTVVRVFYALNFRLDFISPDHLAWQLNLEHAFKTFNFSYARHIHYPHEGGTILISALAIVLKALGVKEMLSVSALVLDTLSRFVQISIVNKVAGKGAAMWYGVWTIFSLPILMQWSGVSFGLHAISGVFPFLFVYLIFLAKTDSKSSLIIGGILGLCGWFIYSNFLFVPIYLLFLVFKKSSLKVILYFLTGFIGVLILHLFIRLNFDPGFALCNVELSSIRGEKFELLNPDSYSYLIDVWIKPFRTSTLLTSTNQLFKDWLQWGWLVISLVSVLILLIQSILKKVQISWSIVLTFVVLYLSLYSASPFYLLNETKANFVLSRHFTLILPFVMAVIVVAFTTFKRTQILMLVIVSVSFFGFYELIKGPKFTQPLVSETGWVLAQKFGHNPELLMSIADLETKNKNELVEGFGWGTTTALFGYLNEEEKNNLNLSKRSKQLAELFSSYSDQYQFDFKNGIQKCFGPHVNPRLDSVILKQFIEPEIRNLR